MHTLALGATYYGQVKSGFQYYWRYHHAACLSPDHKLKAIAFLHDRDGLLGYSYLDSITETRNKELVRVALFNTAAPSTAQPSPSDTYGMRIQTAVQTAREVANREVAGGIGNTTGTSSSLPPLERSALPRLFAVVAISISPQCR